MPAAACAPTLLSNSSAGMQGPPPSLPHPHPPLPPDRPSPHVAPHRTAPHARACDLSQGRSRCWSSRPTSGQRWVGAARLSAHARILWDPIRMGLQGGGICLKLQSARTCCRTTVPGRDRARWKHDGKGWVQRGSLHMPVCTTWKLQFRSSLGCCGTPSCGTPPPQQACHQQTLQHSTAANHALMRLA